MACDDIHKYLAAKHLSINKSFVDVVQKAVMEGEELDFTFMEPTTTLPASVTPLVELPPTVTPHGDFPSADVLVQPTILPPINQMEDATYANTKLPST